MQTSFLTAIVIKNKYHLDNQPEAKNEAISIFLNIKKFLKMSFILKFKIMYDCNKKLITLFQYILKIYSMT